jgi:hypothetical protein
MFVSVAGITDRPDRLAVGSCLLQQADQAAAARPLNPMQEAGWFGDQSKPFLCNQAVAGEAP